MTAAPDHRPTFADVSLTERLDKALPFLLVPILVVLGFFAIGAPSSRLTLTVSGLAMGMMIFIMASGLTLVFGLMDVINFGHGAFVSVGAFVGVSVLVALGDWTGAASLMLNMAAIFLAVVAAMAVTGALGWGVERICIFILLVASYDLLLGYTGIVSFVHTMFFGIGAYGVALASTQMGRGFDSLLVGSLSGACAAILLALLIGLFSLRVRAIFFAMITLAVASDVAVLVSQFSNITGGEDGLTYEIPRVLTSANHLGEVMGVRFTGKILNYYLIFICALVLFLILLRIVNSPFGRVLQAIRENDFRAEAIRYRVVWYRTAATCISATTAALAGSLFAIWLRYVGPDTTLSFEIMLDILLMVVIGGMGTMYGAVLGAVLFILAQTYLQNLMGAASHATEALPLIPELLNPDRWLMWLGILFVLSVYFFPTGIVGRLRRPRATSVCRFSSCTDGR